MVRTLCKENLELCLNPRRRILRFYGERTYGSDMELCPCCLGERTYGSDIILEGCLLALAVVFELCP